MCNKRSDSSAYFLNEALSGGPESTNQRKGLGIAIACAAHLFEAFNYCLARRHVWIEIRARRPQCGEEESKWHT